MQSARLFVRSVISLATLFVTIEMASAAGPVDTTDLRAAVTLDNIRSHQAALQGIADANGGTRRAGTPGGDESAAYVAEQLEAAGYAVEVQEFSFPYFEQLSIPEFQQIAPAATVYPYLVPSGFTTMTYSGSGDVTALVQGVDIVIPPGAAANTSTSGCEPSDFTGFFAGRIALIQRGSCTFQTKVHNAWNAGAVGVVIFNEGQPGRTDAFLGTLEAPTAPIPVIVTSYSIGESLYTASLGTDVTVRIFVDTISEVRNALNVLADLPGHYDRVVMAGAHLDSVAAGPGINDNGSGAAALLEIALQMADLRPGPRNTVRFAWWGAEEGGLAGSTYYLSSLSIEAIKRLNAYLEFEMLGSPNFVRFVFDGDGSSFPPAGPEGSAVIEQIFTDYFAGQGLATEPTPLDGRHSYDAFYNAGIPVGGLFGGDFGIKTPEQAGIYGGTAGEQYDPCYHLACDTFDNVSLEALDQMSDAASHAIQTLAMGSTSSPSNGSGRLTCEALGYDFSLVAEPDGCRQSSGFWKSNPGAWPIASIEIGGGTYTRDEALAIMNAKAKGDKSYSLFIETVAAKLNDDTCGPYGHIAATLSAADDWLAANPPDSGIQSKDSEWDEGGALTAALSEFNSGSFISGSWSLDSLATVDIETLDGIYFDWASSRSVDAVIVKGGRNVNLYEYDPESLGDLGLHAPINSKNGVPYGLSYIEFCYDWDIDISVRKFNDLNNNGIWDDGEPEIGVDQFINPDGTIGGTGGWPYLFSFPMDTGFIGLFWTPGSHQYSHEGTYTIQEQEFELWDPTALYISGIEQPVSTQAEVPYAGDADESVEVIFGNVGYSEILGRKFEDLNGNGIHDAGEPGLEGVEVTLSGEDILGNLVSLTTTTGPDGGFVFLNLVPGTYSVAETAWPPGGWIPSTPTVNGPHILDSGDSLNLGWVFGNLLPGSIHGYKFVDVNGNGVEDAGEPGLAGVTIELTGDVDGDGVLDLIATTTSAPGGEYHFTGLWPGNYTVTEIVPAGWIAVTPTSVDVTVVSGVERVARSGQAMLSPEQIEAGYEEVIDESLVFGNLEPGSIHGYKFNDRDGDGVEDAGELRLPGVNIVLTGDVDGDGDLDELQTTTSGLGGEYGFTGLWPGDYQVSEIPPDGWIPTTPTSTDVTVNSGEELVALAGQAQLPPDSTKIEVVLGSDLTFGNFELGSIHGFKFHDLDADGIWDAGEPRLAGWTFQLFDADGNLADEQTSDESGVYHFTDLGPDSYAVMEVGMDDWTRSTADPPPLFIESGQEYVAEPGLASLPPDSTKYETVETLLAFGNFQTGSIHGLKFEDLDGDGIRDPEEPRLEGWLIELIDAAGNVIATTTTDPGGEYAFTGLLPGDYSVREIVQPDWSPSTPNPVSLSVGSGEEHVAIAGQANLPPDSTKVEIVDVRLAFGNYRFATVSGFKWEDLNADGVWDAGEPGLQGWEICANGSCDITDVTGRYELSLPPGSYSLAENCQVGWFQSFPASADGCGSGVHQLTLVSGQESTDRDFGNYRYATVFGLKWEDLDADGFWDAGEPGLANWEVCANGTCDVTDVTGQYELSLPPGSYSVAENCQAGWLQSFPAPADGCGSGVHQLTLVSGEASTGRDFGNYRFATVSGFKWHDLNADGIWQQANEPGLAGWEICANGTCDLTDASGYYELSLPPGSYTVAEICPDGWFQSFPPPVNGCGSGVYSETLYSGQSAGGDHFGNFSNRPPDAVDDAYSATGNVGISVGAGAGLLANDSDPDGDALTVTAGVVATANGGSADISGDGSFVYTPPPGFNGADSFGYTLSDSSAATDTAAVTITVSDMIWFVNNDFGGAGSGTLSAPLSSLPASVGSAGDCIFIEEAGEGPYDGPLTLLNGQIVVGSGASAAIPTVCGITMALYSRTLPLTGATRPQIISVTNGINLASNNTVRGLDIGDIGGSGFKGTVVGTLAISEVAVGDATPSGGGIEVATSGTLNVTFDSLSASSSTDEGIHLNGVSGSFAVTATDGTISTTGVRAIVIDGNASLNINALTFASVSANGAGYGILLMDTTGSFTVTGDGATAASGGTIQGGNIGISLNETGNVSLAFMQLNNFADFAIRGVNVANFAMSDSIVNAAGSNGNNPAADEGSVRFTNLTGTVSINNCTIEDGLVNNIRIDNSSGVLNMVVSGGSIGLNDVTEGNAGILLQTTGTAEATLTVDGVAFSGARGDMLRTNALDSSLQAITLQNSTLANGHPNIVPGGGGITLSGGSATSNIAVDYALVNNQFSGANGNAITANFVSMAGAVNGVIQDNTIGVFGNPASGSVGGSGISVGAEKNAAGAGIIEHTVLIDSNTIREVDGFAGIEVVSNRGADAVNRAEVRATVTNNSVEDLDGFVATGLYLMAGGSALSGDYAYLCADIRNNSPIDASGATSATNAVWFDQISSDANHNLPGYVGSPDGEFVAGTASTDISTLLTGSNTLTNGGFPSFPGGVDAGFVQGVTGSGTDCL